MSERVSIKREAEVACEIHDLTYRGKQVPAGHARALAALLNARGLLAPESADPVQGDAKLRENSGDTDAPENHENGRSER